MVIMKQFEWLPNVTWLFKLMELVEKAQRSYYAEIFIGLGSDCLNRGLLNSPICSKRVNFNLRIWAHYKVVELAGIRPVQDGSTSWTRTQHRVPSVGGLKSCLVSQVPCLGDAGIFFSVQQHQIHNSYFQCDRIFELRNNQRLKLTTMKRIPGWRKK